MSTGSNNVPPTPGAGDPASGTPPTPNVTFVSTEDFDGHKKFLNKEFAGQRKEVESLSAQMKELRELLQGRSPQPAATGGDKPAQDLPTAEIAREVKELKDQLKQERREKADALIATAITEATASALPEARKALIKALKGEARIEKVNGENVVVVDGEDGPVRLSGEWVRKNYGDFYFPATGKPGSGLTGGGAAGGNPGVDVDRAMADQKYFNENRAAVLAEIDRRRKIGA